MDFFVVTNRFLDFAVTALGLASALMILFCVC